MRGILAHLFLVQDAFPTTWAKINSPFWSISVEWRIYLIFPLLVLAWRRIGALPATLLTLAASYALVFVFLHVYPLTKFNSQTNGLTPQYLALFAFGTLGAGIAYSGEPLLTRLRERGRWWPVTLLLGGAMAFATYRFQHGGTNDDLPGVDLWVGLCAASMLVAVSLREGIVRRILSSRPLTAVGRFAYSIYLIHFPILQIVWQYFVRGLHLGPEKAIFVHMLVGIPAAVGVAYLFFLVCERPFLSARKAGPRARLSAEGA
jgi:peptidoglycan/LPS O-acetylase OafA/YrhL